MKREYTILKDFNHLKNSHMDIVLPLNKLLIITDRSQARIPLSLILDEIAHIGNLWISVREADLTPKDFFEILQCIEKYSHSIFLSLHGGDERIPLPSSVKGLHLPSGSCVRHMRNELGNLVRLGLSIHANDNLDNAQLEGLDYLLAGPFLPSQSKPGYGPALGEKGLEALVKRTNLPLFAIGGITPDTAPLALNAGAYGVAVMGGVMRASDPKAYVQDLIKAIYNEN
jgi:thiamine-phosphate pyrophosphorylase